MENKDKKSIKNFKDLVKNTRYIFLLIWKEMPWVILVMIILTIIMGVVPVIASKVLGLLIDKIIVAVEAKSFSLVFPTLILFTVLTIIPSLFRILRNFSDRKLFLRLQDYLDVLVLKKRASFDIAQIENPKFLNKIQRAFNNGINPLIQLVDFQIANLEVLTGILVGSVAAVTINWRVFVLVLITSIPNFIVEIKYGGRLWGIWAENSPELRRYQDLRKFFVGKTGVIDSKLNNLGSRFSEFIRKILADFTNKQIKNDNKKTKIKTITEIIAGLGFFLGMIIIINESILGVIAIGTVVFAFQTLSRVSGWTSNMLSYTARLLEKNLYVTDIIEILNEKNTMPKPKNPIKIDFSKPPTIIFQNVFFRYQGQAKWALNNVSFRIDPGQKIGLVGDNGSGKTTLIKLLLRVYDPIKGKITINGIDLKNIEVDEWWKQSGILLQDYPDYNFTVKESISISDNPDSFNLDKVVESAKQSTSDTFIDQLEKKYDHMIGVEFDGIEPSKGQRQKLAIARAFYKTKRLLILDEPTASIDADSASKIFRKIESLPKDISAILISHNFSTIKKADKIIVLDNGFKIEEGSHDELLSLKSKYARGYLQQKKEFN
jgi:ABC-type multidrug transport system fused ATPase/permease subunit